MVFAALGGIHGNLPTLEATLEAINREGILTVLCTGDLAVGGPDPAACIALARSRCAAIVQGETDRLVTRFIRKSATLRKKLPPEIYHALGEAFDLVSSDDLEFLRGLHPARTIRIDGIEVALCHGTVITPGDRLHADDPLMRFERQREATPASIIVCGGTPEGFARTVHGTLFVNPGWIGGETGRAPSYAVVFAEEEPWRAELRSVPPA